MPISFTRTMTANRVRQLNAHTDADFDACLEVLLDGYADHKFMVACADADRETLRLTHQTSLTTMLALKRVYVTGDDEKTISSVMFVTPPQSQSAPPNLSVIKENPYKAQLEAKIPDYVKQWRSSKLGEAYKAFWPAMGGREAWDAAYVVSAIATKPSSRGQGQGTALINHVKSQAQAEGRSVIVASQSASTLGWFKKRGFEQLYEGRIELPKGGSVPLLGLRSAS
ncbi:hypothetical protein BD324DRAFT_617370 [Kockovaella imperatae]|uniref:N-acetyltransferase domain-containing protein n=1 Tax=Kockovaella imperatae TaxID=4999 RepID=A0A1Y1US51_9TREE|nr:hypothetical protein BD324DRAFT_617370 [Kockovaella imperatae]ORX40334.1 hypothetical protein BD324DRAFT_617370 [Kockovaella imperatae]